MELAVQTGRGDEGSRSNVSEPLSGGAQEGSNGVAFRYVHQAPMAEPPPSVNRDVYLASMAEPQPIHRDVYRASMAEARPASGKEEQSVRRAAAMGVQNGFVGDAISSAETGENRDEASANISSTETGKDRDEASMVATERGRRPAGMEESERKQNGAIGEAMALLRTGQERSGEGELRGHSGAGRKARILSIDGGGMRGIIPAKALCYVEERLKEKTGNAEARIVDFFDIVAGTSVGGLIGTMLCAEGGHGRPLFSAQQAWQLIAEKGKLIFKIPPLKRPLAKLRGILTPRYSVKNMESILREYLVKEDGQHLTLKDALKPLLIPCYNLTSAGAFLFSRADAQKGDSHNYRLIDVCRATSAVPGFFKPAIFSSLDGQTSIIGIDGGLVMNNPAAATVTHVLNNKEEFPYVQSVADTLVLSLGTGLFDRSYEAEKVKHWGAFQWAKPVARIVLDGISDMVDHSMSMAFSQHSSNYVRIQVSGLPNRCLTEMDDASTSNVKRLTKIADDMLTQPCMQHIPFAGRQKLSITNRERLDWLVDCLIAEQYSRLKSSSPSMCY